MEVKLDKRYPVAASPEQAWTVLCDVRATAACMPGAAITEQLDATHFKGTVKSKVGPAVMMFGGDIELLGVDAAAKELKMLGKGADKSGSSASMNLVAHLEPGADAGSAVLVGQATILVSGKLAQFGSRLLVPVSDAMLGQFAANFNTAAMAVAAAAPPVVEKTIADADGDADAGASSQSAAPASPVSPAAGAAPGTATATATGTATGTGTATAAPAPANELNAMALMWTVFKGWLAGLFGKKG